MTALAGRRRHRRRVALATALAVLLGTTLALSLLWRKSVSETRRAETAARQQEAANLLSLGRLRLGDHPNAALAYAIASLERADSEPARRFAVESLWQGPPALFLPTPRDTYGAAWSPDGRWLVTGGADGVILFERETGEKRQLSSAYEAVWGVTSDNRLLTEDYGARPRMVLHVRTLPDERLDRTLELPADATFDLLGDQLLTYTPDPRTLSGQGSCLLRRLSLADSTVEVLGHWEPHGAASFWPDPGGTWLISLQEGRVVQQRLDALAAPPRVFGTHEGQVRLWMPPWRDRLVTSDDGGDVRVWDLAPGRLARTLKCPTDARLVGLDPNGRYLAAGPGTVAMGPRSLHLFDLAAPRTAEPAPLLASELTYINRFSFSPDGAWLAGVCVAPVVLWNLSGPRSIVVGRQKPHVSVAFTSDGRLVSVSDQEGAMRLWTLDPAAAGEGVRMLWSHPGQVGCTVSDLDPKGRFVVMPMTVYPSESKILLVPLDGSSIVTHELKSRSGEWVWLGAVGGLDPSGRFTAVTTRASTDPEATALRVVDMATGAERIFDTHPAEEERCYARGTQADGLVQPLWLADGRLITDGDGGLRLWDLTTGTSRQLRPCRKEWQTSYMILASSSPGTVVRLDGADQAGQTSTLSVFDLATGATREITSHGNRLGVFALDPSGAILVSGDQEGIIRVGPISGEEPRLLFGHRGPVWVVSVSPDGRRIASTGDDGTIRLWAMPDLSQPPLHTLRHEELLTKLRSLTNLRAVRDPSSETGWKIEVGPFPGWATVPEWGP
jgi:WD40 repeat protein